MRKNAKAVPMIKKFVASIVVALPLLLVDSLANAQSYNADGSNKATTGKSPRTVILPPMTPGLSKN